MIKKTGRPATALASYSVSPTTPRLQSTARLTSRDCGMGTSPSPAAASTRAPVPRTDNANYLWIQLFYSALNDNGRVGFVMANSASDARSSELALRKQVIQARAVDAVVAVGPNMFYTVTPK